MNSIQELLDRADKGMYIEISTLIETPPLRWGKQGIEWFANSL
jgi:hypothetical protein